jgi:predicted amidohydrolase
LQVFIAAGVGRKEEDTFYNSLAFFDRGRYAGFYNKTHLFRDEKHYFRPGNSLVIGDVFGVKTGFFMCYEVGFPEIHRAYAKKHVSLLAGVFAFGKARRRYYDTFTVSRAVENGVYLAASALCGCNASGCEFAGHSRIVAPNGAILGDTLEREGWVVAEIDPKKVEYYQTMEVEGANAYMKNFREGVCDEIRYV